MGERSIMDGIDWERAMGEIDQMDVDELCGGATGWGGKPPDP